MKTLFTPAVGLITGQIKNNPSIYCSATEFTIFLNGELILRGTPNKPMSQKLIFKEATEVLEMLKFGEFPLPEFQKRFDEFIRP